MSRLADFLSYPGLPPKSYPTMESRFARPFFGRQKASGVDWGFISEMEGGQEKVAYVPDPKGSKSGVTIATGFDLGRRTIPSLRGLGLNETLVQKLSPFIGVTGLVAQKALVGATIAGSPLVVTQAEADEIDSASKNYELGRLRKRYERETHLRFGQLHADLQTVIASVAFQYGNLSKKAPIFWRHVVNSDWKSLRDELLNFGDRYRTRRLEEAKRLDPLVKEIQPLPVGKRPIM